MILRTALVFGIFSIGAFALAETPCPVEACAQFNAGTPGCGYCQGCEAAGGDPSIHPQGGGYRVDCVVNQAPPKSMHFSATGSSGVHVVPGRAIGKPMPRSTAVH